MDAAGEDNSPERIFSAWRQAVEDFLQVRRPLDILKEGDIPAVLRAAEGYGEQGGL